MDSLKQEKTRRAAVPRMEDLIPHEVKRTEVMRRLYNNDSLLGEGGIFTEMLQSMINAALEGEMDYTLRSPEGILSLATDATAILIRR